MRLGLVVVHFHTPDLVEPCLRALVDSIDRARARRPIECVGCVVDNGSTAADAQRIDEAARRVSGAACALQRLDPGGNLGYAGAIEAGRDALARAHGPLDAVLVANPDVLVEPPAVGALLEALDPAVSSDRRPGSSPDSAKGADVVGPRFYWDSVGGYRLPPLEAPTRRAELQRFLADRGHAVAQARASWRRGALRQWRAETPVASFELSGALLVVASRAFARVGGFDPAYALYYEETDWLERLRRAGGRAVHVPSAEALHLYAQSTPSEPRAAAWLAASQARFRRLHHGRLFTAAFAAAARVWRAPTADGPRPESDAPAPIDATWLADPRVRRLEISPSPWGFPAAGRQLPRGLEAGEPMIPLALRERLGAGTYRLAAVDGAEREVAVRWIVQPAD